MSVVTSSDEACAEFCEALGLDPGAVQRITIDIKADDVVKVHIKRIATTNEIRLLSAAVLRRGLTAEPVEVRKVPKWGG